MLKFRTWPKLLNSNADCEMNLHDRGILFSKRDEHLEDYAKKRIIKGKVNFPNNFCTGQRVLV